jgi:hypothetical protein
LQALIALLARSFEVVFSVWQSWCWHYGVVVQLVKAQIDFAILHHLKSHAILFQHVTHPVSVLLMASHPVFLSFSFVSKVLR